MKNENEYNRYVIDDLKNQLAQKNKKEENIDYNMISKDDYNNLLKEMENKDNYINKMENEIKNLKNRIDNLLIENKKLKVENSSLISQKEELKAESSANKTECNNHLERLNKLELMNKKLNKDYLNLSNDHKKVKEEKEKLKSIIDEQNAAIFNYEKQLSSKTKMQKYPKNEDYDNKMKTGINFERKYELNNDDENYKYNYSSKKINKYKDYSIMKMIMIITLKKISILVIIIKRIKIKKMNMSTNYHLIILQDIKIKSIQAKEKMKKLITIINIILFWTMKIINNINII